MLAQVERAAKGDKPIVFFGWRPHPMNVNIEMEYLTDGDDFFGPNDGAATVLTNTRPGYSAECPNVGKFLANLAFTVEAEDLMMSYILDDGMSARRGGGEVAEGQPRRARRLARRRHHPRRRAGRRGGASGARALTAPAGGGRGQPVLAPEGAGEGGDRGEAGALGDVGHREPGVEDEPPRRLEAQREVVGAGRGADGGAEQRLEGARRDADRAGRWR